MPTQTQTTFTCDKCGVTTATTTATPPSPVAPVPEGWMSVIVANPNGPPSQYHYDPTCAALVKPQLVKS